MRRITDIGMRYEVARLLVHQIDVRLERGEHLRDRRGNLLLDLGQVVDAILHDNLAMNHYQLFARKHVQPSNTNAQIIEVLLNERGETVTYPDGEVYKP